MILFSSITKKFVNRETISYAFFGMITTIVNIGIFELLFLAGTDYRPANFVALIVTKFFAYIVNKLFVFRTKTIGFGDLLKEFGRYTLARGGTMLIDWFGLILLVSVLGISEHIGKFFTTVIVVILNYVLGKLLVFRKRSTNTVE